MPETVDDDDPRRLVVTVKTLDSFDFLVQHPKVRFLTIRVASGAVPSDLSCTKLKTLLIEGSGGTPTVGPLRVPKTLGLLQLHRVKIANFSIEGASGLEALYLTQCGLTALPALTLPKLRIFSVEQNRLTSLPALSGLPRLERLDGDANALGAFPDVSRNLGLKRISLKKNKLKTVPSLAKLTKLELLVLDENKLSGYDWLAGVPARCRVSLVRTRAKLHRDKLAVRAEWPKHRLTF